MATPLKHRATVTLLLLVALSWVLRVPWLDSVPNPSGDEGNWAWYGLELFEHRPAELHPDARFVSMAFAHLIAGAYGLFGPSFGAARMVLVAGLTLGMALAFLLARRLELPRAAVALAAVLVVHPWSVFWSRTVTVPYALALALGVAGPLAWLLALRTRKGLHVVAASQLLGAAMHFSPLALLPMAACGLTALRERLPRRHIPLALSGALHVVPMLVASRRVVQGYNGRPKHYFTDLAHRLEVFARTVLGGLDGEATLRHATGTHAPLAIELVVAALTLALVLTAAWPSRDTADPAQRLARYARLHLAVAVPGLALILAPARTWNLPAIDAERYAFVFVAPFALLVGALAERPGRVRHLATAAVLWLACGPTARLAWHFARGGSPDTGFYTLAGGSAYRGWKVDRSHRALPWIVRDEIDRLRADGPAQLVMADYAWHPIHMVRAMDRWRWGVTDITKYPLPVRVGVPHLFVLWSPGLFSDGFEPRSLVDDNDRLRALMNSGAFTGQRRVRVLTQPDGSALAELWAATRVR